MKHQILFFFAALLLLCTGCATRTTVVNNISEREANEIVVLLASKGVHAEKAEAATAAGSTAATTYDVSVPSNQVTEAIVLLNQAGLPRVKGTSLLDLFGSQGLVPSDLQDRIRYQEGLSAQLATTIRKMDGIIDANVQITFPKDDEETKEQLTASVYVKHRGILDNPNSLAITKIKRLVSSSIPGLTPENVSVITDRALYADISLDPMKQLEEQRDFTAIWSVIVAKDSVARFRLIFYTFIIILFLLACVLTWLIWKFWRVIETKGGFFTLLHPHQYETGDSSESEDMAEDEGGGGES